MKLFINLILLLVFVNSNAQRNIELSFFVENKKIENYTLYLTKDEQVVEKIEIDNYNAILSDTVFSKNKVILKYLKHLIKLPEIDYYNELNSISVYYFRNSYNNDFVSQRDIRFEHKIPHKRAYYFDLGYDTKVFFYTQKNINHLEKILRSVDK